MGKQTREIFKVRDFQANHEERNPAEDSGVIQSAVEKLRLSRWFWAYLWQTHQFDMMPANLSKTVTSPIGEEVESFIFLPCSYCSPKRGSPWAWCDEEYWRIWRRVDFSSNKILVNVDCSNAGGKDLC